MKKLSMTILALSSLMSFSGVVSAHSGGDFFIRAGTATVRPNVHSDDVLPGQKLEINNNTQLGLTLTYMETDNLGIELLLASPFRHKVSLQGAGQVATIHHLPPALMAQWYFGSSQSTLRPYIGVGLNYTLFFDNSFDQNNGAVQKLKLNNLKLDNSWGVAGQAGVDYMINKNWLLNMSVWYVDINTKVKFKSDEANKSFSVKTQVDPWVFMFTAGYRF